MKMSKKSQIYLNGEKNEKNLRLQNFPKQNYAENIQNAMKILDDLGKKLNTLVSSNIKTRMIKIHLLNIRKAVIYYFDIETQRNSRYIYRNYRFSIKQIFKLTRYLANKIGIEKTKQSIYLGIQTLISKVDTQIKYILEIEKTNFKQRRRKINVLDNHSP